MKVREIFYSIQGEGARMGIPSIFIRLAHCNLNCWFCDTDWSHGEEMTIEEIMKEIQQYPCVNIIWTGGEPTLQLTEEIVEIFKIQGYHQSIESNGTNIIPNGIDYITLSPKIEPRLSKMLNPDGVDEIRMPISKGDLIPDLNYLPKADHYFLSPVFLGDPKERYQLDPQNVEYCIEAIKMYPPWRLSIQLHKILNVR